jgi:putative ABC transport system substrate-binding protein
MNRREAVFALLALGVAPGLVNAQTRPAHLALIMEGATRNRSAMADAFRESLRENGLVEGKDYVFDLFWAEGKYERLPVLLEAVLKRNPSIILVSTIASVRAAQQATKSIPILMLGTNDPVGSGLVASLARPGGNTTGLTMMFDDVAAKLVEFAREGLPKAKRLAVLINPLNPSNRPIFLSLQKAALSLGMTAEAFEADAPERIGGALTAASKTQPDALITGFDAMLLDQRAQIISLGLARKIPVVSPSAFFGDAGALITYGAPTSAFIGRATVYVKKLLAGAKPAELPVEQPTTFELVINMKTAKALGIKIPQSILVRADRVIE